MSTQLSFVIHPFILAVILAVAILILSAFSVAFLYHWREYGMDTRLSKLAPVLYLSVTAGLCVFALISYFALI